jgi:ABC-type amino acid transport system permease subunit
LPHLRALCLCKLARTLFDHRFVSILNIDCPVERDSSRTYSLPYLSAYLSVSFTYGSYLLHLFRSQIQLPHKIAVWSGRAGIRLTRRHCARLVILRESLRRENDKKKQKERARRCRAQLPTANQFHH